MKDLFTIIKTEIPNFFITIINILSLPRTYILQLLHKHGSNKDEALVRALVYYVICIFLAIVFMTPIYGEDEWKILSLTYSIVVPTIQIILAAMMMKIAWKIVNLDGDYFDFFILLLYQIGTIFTVYLLITFINLSILRFLSLDNFKMMVQYTFLKNKSVGDPFENILTEGSILLYAVINVLSTIGVIWWFLYSWRVFRTKVNATKIKSFIALAVFSILMVPVYFMALVLSDIVSNR